MVRVFLTYRGSSLELEQGETVVGRDPSCRVRLHALSVSRRHARFFVSGDVVEVEDLGSRNGTLINGEPVSGRRRLARGDEITFGERCMILLTEDADSEFEPITAVTDPPAGRFAPAPPQVTQEMAPMPERVGLDRRRHPRRELEIPILYESDDLQVEAMSLNLSWSGVFIRTSILDQVGTSCRLTVCAEDRGCYILAGRVRRVVEVPTGEEPLGLGIEFSDLETGARRWLEGKLQSAPRLSL